MIAKQRVSNYPSNIVFFNIVLSFLHTRFLAVRSIISCTLYGHESGMSWSIAIWKEPYCRFYSLTHEVVRRKKPMTWRLLYKSSWMFRTSHCELRIQPISRSCLDLWQIQRSRLAVLWPYNTYAKSMPNTQNGWLLPSRYHHITVKNRGVAAYTS